MKTSPTPKSRVAAKRSKPASTARNRTQTRSRAPVIRRILVPVDFSKFSEKAVRYAAGLAEKFGGKVVLLHVQSVPYYPPELGLMPATFPTFEPQTKALRQKLDTEARRLLPPGVLDRTELRTGTAFDEICNAARKLRADLIVIPTHGYTGLKHVLLGSTAERVVRHAPCPVLTVR